MEAAQSTEGGEQNSRTADSQEEFLGLLNSYNTTIRVTSGCGERGQIYIDEEWKRLRAFVNKHPEFEGRLPKKHLCDDDGY